MINKNNFFLYKLRFFLLTACFLFFFGFLTACSNVDFFKKHMQNSNADFEISSKEGDKRYRAIKEDFRTRYSLSIFQANKYSNDYKGLAEARKYLNSNGIKIDIKSNGFCSILLTSVITLKVEQAYYIALRFLDKNGCNDNLVRLNSRGGNVDSGIRMGLVSRYLGVSTVVVSKVETIQIWPDSQYSATDGCYSSCAAIFVGGKIRYGAIRAEGSLFAIPYEAIQNKFGGIGEIGFHQASRGKECLTSPNDQTNLLLKAYYKDMVEDVSDELYSKMITTSCKKISKLSSHEKFYETIVTSAFSKNLSSKY